MSYHVSDPSVVWKHVLPVIDARADDGVIKVELPSGHKVVRFAFQPEGFCIWEVHRVRNNSYLFEETFWFTGTGEEIPGWLQIIGHVGSIQQDYFVWHLFKVADQRENMAKEN